MKTFAIVFDEDSLQCCLNLVYDHFHQAYKLKRHPMPAGHWEAFWAEEYKTSGQLLKALMKQQEHRWPAGGLESVLQAALELP